MELLYGFKKYLKHTTLWNVKLMQNISLKNEIFVLENLIVFSSRKLVLRTIL